jgi:hypothetical protein
MTDSQVGLWLLRFKQLETFTTRCDDVEIENQILLDGSVSVPLYVPLKAVVATAISKTNAM